MLAVAGSILRDPRGWYGCAFSFFYFHTAAGISVNSYEGFPPLLQVGPPLVPGRGFVGNSVA